MSDVSGPVLNDLEARLEDLAESCAPGPDPFSGVRRRVRTARRRRRVTVLGVVVAAVCTLALLIAPAVVRDRTGLPIVPADGPLLGWTAAGNAVDSPYAQVATKVWDNASVDGSPLGSHTDVRALLVQMDRALGPVIVLQGVDSEGRPRVALVTASVGDRENVRLRADAPAPDPNSTKVLSFMTARMGISGDGMGDPVWLIAVAAPGVDRITAASTAVDESSVEGAGPPSSGRLLVTTFPRYASAFNSTVTLYRGGRQVLSTPVSHSGLGDATAIPVEVLSRNGADYVVRRPVELHDVATNAVVATADGLIGIVRSTTDRELNVVGVTDKTFAMRGEIAIAGISGKLVGDGNSLYFDPDDSAAVINGGNRVVVDAPAGDKITLGRIEGNPVDGPPRRTAKGYVVKPTASTPAVGSMGFIMIVK